MRFFWYVYVVARLFDFWCPSRVVAIIATEVVGGSEIISSVEDKFGVTGDDLQLVTR
jgi:hypothetical protein